MDGKYFNMRLLKTWIPLWLSIITLLFIPGYALALGVGKIKVLSALNQTLNAEIPILSATEEELNELKVRISAQSFDGLGRGGVGFDYTVETEGNRDFIRIITEKPLREPLLNLLIEVEWPSGRLLREFGVLLNPPKFVTQTQPAADLPPLPVRQTTRTVERNRPDQGGSSRRIIHNNAAATASNTAPTASTTSSDRPAISVADDAPSYQVRRGDTLWKIANRLRPNSEVSVQKMMLALLDTNPHAFVRNDMNALLAGAELQVPTVDGFAPQPAAQTDTRIAAANDNSAASQRPSNEQSIADTQLAGTDTRAAEPAAERAEVRLVSPESAAADTATTSLGLASSFRIQLSDDHPQLRLANFADLQTRIDALVGIDNQALTAAQETLVEPGKKPPVAGVETPVIADNTTTEAAAPDIVPAPAVDLAALAESELESELVSETMQAEPVVDTSGQIVPAGPVEVAADTSTSTEQTSDNISTAQTDTDTGTDTEAGADTSDQITITSATDTSAENTTTDDTQTVAAVSQTAATLPIVNSDSNPGAGGDQVAATDWVSQIIRVMDEPSLLLEDPVLLAMVGGPLVLMVLLPVWLLSRRSSDDDEYEDEVFEQEQEQEQSVIPLAERARAQRERAKQVAAADGDAAVGTQPAKAARPAVSPIERIDLLLAVSNYREAENVTRLALVDNPNDTVLLSKMTEIQFATGNAEGFANYAEQLHAQVGDENDALWQQALAKGRQLCPTHSLFATSAADGDDLAFAADEQALDFSNDTTVNEETAVNSLADATKPQLRAVGADFSAEDETKVLDFNDFDFQTPEVDIATEDAGGQTVAANLDDELKEVSLDVNLNTLDDTQSGENNNVSLEPISLDSTATDVDFEDILQLDKEDESTADEGDLLDSLKTLDFEFEPAVEKAEPIDLDLASADLTAGSSGDESAVFSAESDAADNVNELGGNVETKLELATAYLDMEDKIGARSLLEEVIEEGDTQQQARAKQLMERLSA